MAVFELGLAESREKAKAYIMAGQIYVNGVKNLKSGSSVKSEDIIEIKGEKMPFVSRGGFKLQKAIEVFDINLCNLICMDVGASTGGFTDCMLQHGAKKVYSVDVGYGQLSWKLRTDDRVINLERTNFRYVTDNEIKDKINFSSVDVSFISLTKILPVLFERLCDDGKAVCLIKPQFEAGKENVGKKGVVRDTQVHIQVINKIIDFALDNHFSVLGLDYSPIKGPQGNIEYLLYIAKSANSVYNMSIDVCKVVGLSHDNLDKEE